MSPSAYRVSSPPGPGEGGGGGQTTTKTFLGQVGICLPNFIKIGAGGWISISPPRTNRQTNKHLYAHFYIFRREDRSTLTLEMINQILMFKLLPAILRVRTFKEANGKEFPIFKINCLINNYTRIICSFVFKILTLLFNVLTSSYFFILLFTIF